MAPVSFITFYCWIIIVALTCKQYSNIADSRGGADFNCFITMRPILGECKV